jgi:hypothetical protein
MDQVSTGALSNHFVLKLETGRISNNDSVTTVIDPLVSYFLTHLTLHILPFYFLG